MGTNCYLSHRNCLIAIFGCKYAKLVNFLIFNFQTRIVGDQPKVPQEAKNLLKQVTKRQIPDSHVKRKLTAVNIEDVPLVARLNLARGKGAITLVKTISDITTEDIPTDKKKYKCRKCEVCTIMINLLYNI